MVKKLIKLRDIARSLGIRLDNIKMDLRTVGWEAID
jgi:hypothetical protein